MVIERTSPEVASSAGKGGAQRTGPIPLRSCVACGAKDAKRELIRLVRNARGEVEIDLSGKKSGRGAYLCKARSCWETGLKRNRLEHALRAVLTPQQRRELELYGTGLPAE